MNQLLSIVALETLPGWPAVPNPSPLVSLGLLLGLPALGALVIIALVYIRARLVGDYGAQMHAAAWSGDRPDATIAAGVPPTAIDTSSAVGPDGEPIERKSVERKSVEKTGGASAKW